MATAPTGAKNIMEKVIGVINMSAEATEKRAAEEPTITISLL